MMDVSWIEDGDMTVIRGLGDAEGAELVEELAAMDATYCAVRRAGGGD